MSDSDSDIGIDSGITLIFSHFGIRIGIKSLRNVGIAIEIGIKIARNRNHHLKEIVTFTGIESGIGIGIMNVWNRNWNRNQVFLTDWNRNRSRN